MLTVKSSNPTVRKLETLEARLRHGKQEDRSDQDKVNAFIAEIKAKKENNAESTTVPF